jgi:hypothetical protein
MPLSDYYPDLAGWKPVEPNTQAAPVNQTPIGPSQSPVGEIQNSPYLRTSLPLPLTYQPDSLKQYNRPNLSTFRIAPLPPGGTPAINSASTSTIISSLQEFVNTAAGGPNGSIQFNNSGALGGTNSLTWNFGGSVLSVLGSFTVTGTVNGLTLPTATGNATVAQVIASGTAALGTSPVAGTNSAPVVTVAATGVLATDSISWSFNAIIGSGYVQGLVVQTYVTAGNVNFLVTNPTAGSLTPSAATVNWKVIR